MRAEEDLNSPEFQDDMTPLMRELESRDIKYTIKPHPGATPKLLDLIGYYPTGGSHIMVGDVSIIRGMASFGLYEGYGGPFEEPERFSDPKELVDAIVKYNETRSNSH